MVVVKLERQNFGVGQGSRRSVARISTSKGMMETAQVTILLFACLLLLHMSQLILSTHMKLGAMVIRQSFIATNPRPTLMCRMIQIMIKYITALKMADT